MVLEEALAVADPGPPLLLRVPWTARRTNLSILKEINPECSLEGHIVKPRLQYFSNLVRTEDSLEKTLILGECAGKRRNG